MIEKTSLLKRTRFYGKYSKRLRNDFRSFNSTHKSISAWYKEEETGKSLLIEGINFGPILEFPVVMKLCFNGGATFKENKINKFSRMFIRGISSSSAEILIFLESNVRIKQFVPIIKELERRRTTYCVVTSNLSVKLRLRQEGVKSDFIKPEPVNAEVIINRIVKSIRKDYLYHNEKIDSTLKEIVKTWIPHLLGLKIYIDELFRIKNPKAIILENDIPAEPKLIIQIAKKKGIKSYVLQHGVFYELLAYLPSTADKVFVWGVDSKKFYESARYKEKAIVTGNPLFDNILLNKSDLKKILGISQNNKVILLTPSRDRNASMSEYKIFLNNIFSQLSKMKNTVGIIKLHPLDRGKFHHELMKKYPKIIYARTPTLKTLFDRKIKAINTPDLIKICDVLVSDEGSSTLIEAQAFFKPAIQFDLKKIDKLNLTPFTIFNINEFKSTVERILNMNQGKVKKICNSTIAYQLYRMDGKASGRIIDCMLR